MVQILRVMRVESPDWSDWWSGDEVSATGQKGAEPDPVALLCPLLASAPP